MRELVRATDVLDASLNCIFRYDNDSHETMPATLMNDEKVGLGLGLAPSVLVPAEQRKNILLVAVTAGALHQDFDFAMVEIHSSFTVALFTRFQTTPTDPHAICPYSVALPSDDAFVGAPPWYVSSGD